MLDLVDQQVDMRLVAHADADAYRQVLQGKWKQMQIVTDTPDSLTGTGDDGDFRVTIAGSRVTSIEGLPPAEHAKVN